MSVPVRKTPTIGNPITTEEVERFRDNIEIGESLTALYPTRHWTSCTNFVMIPRKETVTILRKYRYLAETDRGILSWKELLAGYYGCSFYGKEPEEKPAFARRKAA